MNGYLFSLLTAIAVIFFTSITNKDEIILFEYTSEPIEVVSTSLETEKNIELLARIAQGEAIGEGLLGMQLIIEVVLNRTASKRWPSTIEEVIKQKRQFCGLYTRNYKISPSKELLTLAYNLLLNKQTRAFPTKVYWFYNPKIATNTKFINSIRNKYTTAICGNHEYAY